jgi:hypothetical protein
MIKSRKMKWAKRVARMGDRRTAYSVFVKETAAKRSLKI